MKLKRITYFLISFLLFTCIFISSGIKTNAATLSSVSYSVDNAYIQAGQTFNIYVNCQNISDLYGASVDFKYDTTLIKILDITKGEVFTNSGKIHNTVIQTTMPDTTGTVSMGLSLQSNISGFTGNGKLFVIKATALKTGTVNLKTTNDSSQLATNGLNMCVKLANSTTDAKISGVTYSNSSFSINKAVDKDSVMVSNTFPTTMLPGQKYNVQIVVKNTGSETWTAAKNYKLAPVGYSDPFHKYKLVLSPSDNIQPGQTKTFTYSMIAPVTPGTYTSDWQMYVEGTVWFGQSIVKQIIVENSTKSASIVSDNFPTTLLPGQSYHVKIVVKNTGTDNWTASKNYKLAPVGYNDPFNKYKLILSSSDNIKPGQTKTFAYTIKAPLTPGTYTTDWQMYQEGLLWFGQSVVKQIIVGIPPRSSLIVSNNIPTTMVRGRKYNVQIVVKNTGTDTWTAAKNYKLAPVGYSDPFHNYKLVLSSNDKILPGQTKAFTFSMKAPSSKGTFTSDWQMYVEKTAWFGQSVVKHIMVK